MVQRNYLGIAGEHRRREKKTIEGQQLIAGLGYHSIMCVYYQHHTG